MSHEAAACADYDERPQSSCCRRRYLLSTTDEEEDIELNPPTPDIPPSQENAGPPTGTPTKYSSSEWTLFMAHSEQKRLAREISIPAVQTCLSPINISSLRVRIHQDSNIIITSTCDLDTLEYLDHMKNDILHTVPQQLAQYQQQMPQQTATFQQQLAAMQQLQQQMQEKYTYVTTCIDCLQRKRIPSADSPSETHQRRMCLPLEVSDAENRDSFPALDNHHGDQ
ncbi:hypothetical protein V5799_018048 [Amblyomma americanum]|uniref:Uncharacterized protein n=1 Tax=Amblyomma americanum TaxID=6943 RepID=A0AAQ4F0Z4_AMBAM